MRQRVRQRGWPFDWGRVGHRSTGNLGGTTPGGHMRDGSPADVHVYTLPTEAPDDLAWDLPDIEPPGWATP